VRVVASWVAFLFLVFDVLAGRHRGTKIGGCSLSKHSMPGSGHCIKYKASGASVRLKPRLRDIEINLLAGLLLSRSLGIGEIKI
jgi:hypothetical protein